jgi:polyhydroxybutyrate depolymerase
VKYVLFCLAGLATVLAGLYYFFLYVPRVPAPALRGELRYAELDVAGLRRGFHYYHRGGQLPLATPLVFVLHGSTSKGEDARYQYGYRFDVLADEFGFIPVYPTGYDNHWNDCRAAADYLANVEDIDDIAFFQAMIRYFADRYDADPARVFATGLSNGGHMAYRLALETPDLVRAIAPIAASLPVWEESDCQASERSVPVAIINGTEDPVNPYAGGLVEIFGNASRGTVMSSQATAEYFADLAGYARTTAVVHLADRDPDDDTRVELTAWQSPGRNEVLLYTVHGGGHSVPSMVVPMPKLLGRTSRDLDAADEIWAFFQRTMHFGTP